MKKIGLSSLGTGRAMNYESMVLANGIIDIQVRKRIWEILDGVGTVENNDRY